MQHDDDANNDADNDANNDADNDADKYDDDADGGTDDPVQPHSVLRPAPQLHGICADGLLLPLHMCSSSI